MSRILVTGSDGFIGRHTCSRLLTAGHDVIGLDKNAQDWVGAGPRVSASCQCDITNHTKLKKIFTSYEPNAVIHLAANSSLQRSIKEPTFDAISNIIGTLNVIEAAKASGCKRIVFASTSAVYGNNSDSPYHERMPREPMCQYGISKSAGEMYIQCSGLSYAILRYANVYGPGQRPLGENILIARLLAHIFQGEPFNVYGDGEQVRDFIFVRDVADANLYAMESPRDGIYNIATGMGHSVNHVVSIIRHLTGYKTKIKNTEAKPGELRTVVLLPSMAWRDLGWKSIVQLVEGLKETIYAWQEDHKKRTS
jgi:UDP-glucose 4-epimerase